MSKKNSIKIEIFIELTRIKLTFWLPTKKPKFVVNFWISSSFTSAFQALIFKQYYHHRTFDSSFSLGKNEVTEWIRSCISNTGMRTLKKEPNSTVGLGKWTHFLVHKVCRITCDIILRVRWLKMFLVRYWMHDESSRYLYYKYSSLRLEINYDNFFDLESKFE